MSGLFDVLEHSSIVTVLDSELLVVVLRTVLLSLSCGFLVLWSVGAVTMR